MGEQDGTLLERWDATSDQDAFMELVTRYQSMVYGACFRIVKDRARAEDLVQECFLKLTQKRPRDIHSLGPWLHRMATNASLRVVESEKRRTVREQKYVSEQSPGREATWNDVEWILDEALNALVDKERDVLVARFLEGRTQADVAERLGITRATVHHRIQRGLDSLRKKLSARGVVIGGTALSTMLTSNAAMAAPATLTTIIGKGVLAGAFQPVRIAALPKILGLAAAVLVVLTSGFMFFGSTSGESAETLGFAEESTMEVELPEPLVVAAAVEVVEQPDSQEDITLVNHPSGDEAEIIRLQCVDRDGNPVVGARVVINQWELGPDPTPWSGFVSPRVQENIPRPVSDVDGIVEFGAFRGDRGALIVRTALARRGDELIGIWEETERIGFPMRYQDRKVKLVPTKTVTATIKIGEKYRTGRSRIQVTQLGTKSALRPGGEFFLTFDNLLNKSDWPESYDIDLRVSTREVQIKGLPSEGSFGLKFTAPWLATEQRVFRNLSQVDTIALDTETHGIIKGRAQFLPLGPEQKSNFTVRARLIDDFSNNTFFEAKPRASGRFEIPQLPAGTYEVALRWDGFPEDYVAMPLQDIRVHSGQDTTGVNLTLGNGSRLRGRVYNRDTNEPIPNAELRARYAYGARHTVINAAKTNGLGHYRLRVPGETIYIEANAPGFKRYPSSTDEHFTVPPSDTSGPVLDIGLEPVRRDPKWDNPPVVSGRVIDENGAPIPNISLVHGGWLPVAVTDIGGRFRFELTPDQYSVTVGGSGWSQHSLGLGELVPGERRTLNDIVLTRYPGKLAIRVVDESGEPLDHVNGHIGADGYVHRKKPYEEWITERDGMIFFSDLPNRELNVAVDKTGYIDNTWSGLPRDGVVEIVLKRSNIALPEDNRRFIEQ